MKFYKDNNAAIKRDIFRNRHGVLLATEDSVDSLQLNQSYLKITNQDWTRAAEFKMIEGAFIRAGWDGYRVPLLFLLDDLHKHIWPRYLKYHKKKKASDYRLIKETDAMRELLFRGFIHINQARWKPERPYTIQADIGDLVWPESYKHHQDAIQKRDQITFGGYGRCDVPKDYDYAKKTFTTRGLHTRGFKFDNQ